MTSAHGQAAFAESRRPRVCRLRAVRAGHNARRGQRKSGSPRAEDRLGREVVDLHRAIVSIRDEVEAVDWYDRHARRHMWTYLFAEDSITDSITGVEHEAEGD